MAEEAILGWLKGDTPNVQGQEFPLRQREITIGRGTQCEVQLSDPKISRKHARLRFGEDNILLEDLKSSHGTLVNGQRGEFFVLKDGDVIAMGDTLLVFKISPDTMATLMAPEVNVPARPVAPPPQPVAAPVMAPAPDAGDGKKKPKALMFFLGLVPVLLVGAAVIALFIVLGGEPEPYEPSGFWDEQVAVLPTASLPTATGESTGQEVEIVATEQAATETPESAAPEFTVHPRDPVADEDALDLSQIVIFNEAESSIDQVVFDAEIPYGEDLGFDYFQCAVDEETLKENLAYVTVNFIVEGLSIGLDELAFSEWDRGDRYCYFYAGVITGLPVGPYEILSRYEQSEEYFDGFDTYPPGVLETLYRVEVADTEETVAGSSDLPEEGPRVRLHVGDARFFTTPPDVVAYANTLQTSPPGEIRITENCGASCWRYNEWVAVGEPGQYLEAEATVSVTAIGVQLWGDDNDGWARVLVDGQEMWVGEMRGEDNQWPGGAFVRYLEIAGLAPGSHTLRVEPTGEGGPVTVYFFGIGEVKP
jgi:pSer/pThr/pTyr-binding forkhead associated (FHA) protein